MFKNLNPEIAELIGMHTGDGTLYQTNRGMVWEIRGNLNEKEYYFHVKKLLESIFEGEFFNPKFRKGGKNGCYGIQKSGRIISDFLIGWGFKPGCKTYTVGIPDYIKQGDKQIKFAFIRGLFDTDGCLRFRKINNKKYDYPQIEFCFASVKLRDDLFNLFNDLGYKVFKWGKNDSYKLALAGINNLERFMKEVSSKNTKHLNKYSFWKKHGYRNPNAAVA